MQEKQYRIENPTKLSPANMEEFTELLDALSDPNPAVKAITSRTQEGYLSWEEFKNKDWVSKDKEKIWRLVKFQRRLNNKATTIIDEENKPFLFDPRSHVQFLHQVDLELGGNFMGIQDFSEGDKQRFIRRNLIEESIASSQLEGANTSRAAAKKMLQEGRAPKSDGEHMIVNNHETMQWIEESLKNEELSLETLKELHRRITRNTIPEEHQGILRETLNENGEPLVVKPWGNVIAYVTPPREFVEEQLPRLIAFANDKDGGDFIHPLIKAIMVHFWIGILHPFEDGNGRLARVLFYWYMLKKGYWAFSYLSLSECIKRSPKQYAMAYIYSEQDDNDLNYFVHYNIEKLRLARKKFEEYIQRKILENRQASEFIKRGYGFNERQVRLLQYLVNDEQRFTTLNEYHHSNNTIGKVTAAHDLKKLVEEDLLEKKRRGRNIFYYPTPKIQKLFR